jgi:flagellar biosynthesis protein FlhF
LPGGGVEIMAVAAREMAALAPTAEFRESDPGTAALSGRKRSHGGVNRTTATPSALSAAPEPPTAMPGKQFVPPVQRAALPLPPFAERSLLPLEVPRSLAVSEAPPPAAAAPAVAVATVVEAEVVPSANVLQEIRSLRRIVEQHLAGFAWGEAARAEPVKTETLRHLLDAGFSPQFARDLLLEVPPEVDAVQALACVKGGAERRLLTINSETDIIDQGGIYALVGPTGVGKTTTTAKLAARCVLRHGARKLALVTTDGYRIGAHEQLRIYGRILGVPVHLARDTKDLRATLRDLKHTHMVLIDTMGMSQRDRMVGEQVAMFGDSEVRSLLLLAATSRGDTLDDVVRAYGALDLAGCILTKVDEAASLASALDVILRQSLRLYYVSNGQRVPEDLHLPNRPYLLHRAFKDLPDSSPHRMAGLEHGLMMASAAVGGASAGGQGG